MIKTIRGLHHDHIDGSIAVKDVIEELYRVAGKKFPFLSSEEWLAFFRDESINIVERFNTVTGVLQTREALELMAYVYGRKRASEGHVYVEGKFAPQYHLDGGYDPITGRFTGYYGRDGRLTIAEVAEAIRIGLNRAEIEFGIELVPVICIGREASEEVGIEVAKVACEYDGEMVLDLVCDESEHPPEKHLKAFQLTFGTNVKRDCHAGEWVTKEPIETYKQRLTKNIWTALRVLRSHGIGHAIPLGDNPDLIDYVLQNGVRVSGCPLSNLRSGLIKNLGELRITELLSRGVLYTLNADDDLFLPGMETVIRECDDFYHFTESEWQALKGNVFKAAFKKKK